MERPRDRVLRRQATPPDGGGDPRLAAPWAEPAAALVAALDTEVERGLTDAEAERRLRLYGPNLLRRIRRRSSWRILWDQFASLIVVLLVVAAAVAFAFDETVEGFAIVAVIVINAAIGFVTERRAVRSMEALRELGRTETRVRRGGTVRELPASLLVPGDIVVLDAGDVLTADVRLVSGSRLQADESALTGESLPVDKTVRPGGPGRAPPGAPLHALQGHGGHARLRRGASWSRRAWRPSSAASRRWSRRPSPRPRRSRSASTGSARRLIGLTLAIAALVAVAVLASGRELYFAIEIAIALAVATIPEGLPIVATVALARGMWRMARRNALVEQLAAVETLGSTTVILTDKTGTLTENRMTAVELRLARGAVRIEGTGLQTTGDFRIGDEAVGVADVPELCEALRVGVLCNNATLLGAGRRDHATGDPTEVALLVAGAKAGLARERSPARLPGAARAGLRPRHQRMATLHADPGAPSRP